MLPPSHLVPSIREHPERELVNFQWGLISSWAKDKKMAQVNARADSVAEKPMFRSAFKKRRCLVLADGFFEWEKAEGGKGMLGFQVWGVAVPGFPFRVPHFWPPLINKAVQLAAKIREPLPALLVLGTSGI
jgi:putative SOS response-associated peptidase YedK